MAAPELRDYRGRISVLADITIDAEARATGRERQEIVREILDKWADERLQAHILLGAALAVEGIGGLDAGVSGHAPQRSAERAK